MATLTGVLIDPQIVGNSTTQGLVCFGALEADLCVTRVLPIDYRESITVDRVMQTQWKADFIADRLIPIGWNGCLLLTGKALGKLGMGQQLGGGSRIICPSLFNRVVPIRWKGKVLIDRIAAISWLIPFIEVDRILVYSTAQEVLVDRLLEISWKFLDFWTKQGDAETDAWTKQGDAEADAWTKQAAGETDIWS